MNRCPGRKPDGTQIQDVKDNVSFYSNERKLDDGAGKPAS